MDRRKAREYAFIIIFQYKFQPNDIDEILSDFFEKYDAGKQSSYINDVVLGVVKNIEEIDKKIVEFSNGWSIDRIGAVNLAALRIGVYEMFHVEDIPLAVSVNEATGLAKEYAGDEAVAFVNGVLGGIQKQLEI